MGRRRLITIALALVLVPATAVALARDGDGDGERDAPAVAAGSFTDEFDGTAVNRRVWRSCHWWSVRGCTILSNDELEWYLPSQARVRDGKLRLVAERRPVRTREGDFEYRSGMISSGPGPEVPARRAYRYGRFSIRAKVPVGRGLWSAFWLLPADRESKPEIDVMEVLGHRPTVQEMHFHYRNADGETRQKGTEWDGLVPGRFHVFEVEWRPRRLTWRVDGVRRWQVTGDIVPDEPMYPIVNLAVGGGWPGDPDADTRFPAALEVDWIRVRP